MSNRLLWLVLRVLPQKEFEAEKRIKASGNDALCPYEERWVKRAPRSPKKRLWRYPLFTRYVFACFQSIQEWRNVEAGVDPDYRVIKAPIGFDGKPAVLTAAEVEYWREGRDGSIKVGEDVLVADGPFQGQLVKVISIRGKRAKIMLDAMPLIDIPLAKLDKV